MNLTRKKFIFILILFSISNCIAWPSAILGLLPKTDKAQQVLFPPPGNSNPSPATNSDNSNSNPAGFTISSKTGIITSESGTSSSFSVKLNSTPTSEVEIKISSSNSSEITANPISLKFTEANWNTPQIVNLTGVDDTLQDGNKTVTIDLGSGISKDINYNNLSVGTVEATNADNETTGITVSALGGHIVTEAGGTSSFTVVLNSIPSGDVTIPVTSNDLTEGTVSPSSITFTNSNWNIPQTVTITGIDDPNPDGNISFTVSLGPSTSSDTNYNNLSQPNIAVINEDNDTAGFTIINPTITTNESGTNGGFLCCFKF
ncbi:MAG: hypothetical protein IPO06_27760 [Leptospiraceae bacterium]|nr:hypothetical protein [Leptospiraceae bacterium]